MGGGTPTAKQIAVLALIIAGALMLIVTLLEDD